METIDVFALARTRSRRRGRIDLAAMPRLASSLARVDGSLTYDCQGRIDEQGRPGLHLALEARLAQRCDRCGHGMELLLAVESDFYFVQNERDLAAVAIDDSPDEALVGSAQFDLAGLIEDEAILQLPISPRHQSCAPPGARAGAQPGGARGAERPHPFAPLADLRDRLGPAPGAAPRTAPKAARSARGRKSAPKDG